MLSNRLLLPAILWLSCPLFVSSLHAQSDVLSAGGDASGSGSLSWSLGQVDGSAFTGTTGSVQAGVQQGSPAVGPTAVRSFTGGWHVYPNPFERNLNLRTPYSGSWTLNDMSGRLCGHGCFQYPDTRIMLEPLPAGMYFLTLAVEGQPPFAIPLLRQ